MWELGIALALECRGGGESGKEKLEMSETRKPCRGRLQARLGMIVGSKGGEGGYPGGFCLTSLQWGPFPLSGRGGGKKMLACWLVESVERVEERWPIRIQADQRGEGMFPDRGGQTFMGTLISTHLILRDYGKGSQRKRTHIFIYFITE